MLRKFVTPARSYKDPSKVLKMEKALSKIRRKPILALKSTWFPLFINGILPARILNFLSILSSNRKSIQAMRQPRIVDQRSTELFPQSFAVALPPEASSNFPSFTQHLHACISMMFCSIAMRQNRKESGTHGLQFAKTAVPCVQKCRKIDPKAEVFISYFSNQGLTSRVIVHWLREDSIIVCQKTVINVVKNVGNRRQA